MAFSILREGCTQNMSGHARRTLETNEGDKASVAEIGETVDTSTVIWVLQQSQLYGRVTERSHC